MNYLTVCDLKGADIANMWLYLKLTATAPFVSQSIMDYLTDWNYTPKDCLMMDNAATVEEVYASIFVRILHLLQSKNAGQCIDARVMDCTLQQLFSEVYAHAQCLEQNIYICKMHQESKVCIRAFYFEELASCMLNDDAYYEILGAVERGLPHELILKMVIRALADIWMPLDFIYCFDWNIENLHPVLAKRMMNNAERIIQSLRELMQEDKEQDIVWA